MLGRKLIASNTKLDVHVLKVLMAESMFNLVAECIRIFRVGLRGFEEQYSFFVSHDFAAFNRL